MKIGHHPRHRARAPVQPAAWPAAEWVRAGFDRFREAPPMHRRAPILALVIWCLAPLAPAARANLITYYFTGTVTQTFTDVDFPGATVPPIAVGDPVAGALRFDDRP